MKAMKNTKSKEFQYELSYEDWCKQFNVSSRLEKRKLKNFYGKGEYDYEKFKKMIQSYDKNKKQSPIWEQASETFFTLCKRKMQKAWNRFSLA